MSILTHPLSHHQQIISHILSDCATGSVGLNELRRAPCQNHASPCVNLTCTSVSSFTAARCAPSSRVQPQDAKLDPVCVRPRGTDPHRNGCGVILRSLIGVSSSYGGHDWCRTAIAVGHLSRLAELSEHHSFSVQRQSVPDRRFITQSHCYSSFTVPQTQRIFHEATVLPEIRLGS